MNIKKIILISSLLFVVAFSYFIVSKASTMKVKGVVTDINNGCAYDDVCSVEIDGKWWVTVTIGGLWAPGSEPLRGEVVRIEFDEERSAIGKKVEVYGEKVGENFLTIYGSKEYYIRVIDD